MGLAVHLRAGLCRFQLWLTAGVSEDGEWSKSIVGTPQGAVISPLLGNVFMHYVFDLWIQWWRKKRCSGNVVVIRYADDFVIGFERKGEAEACLKELQERFAKFGLKLHEMKTRLIEFGRFAIERRQERGEGKPETFDFLGFTHRCDKTRSHGWYNYHAIPGNMIRLQQFRDEITKLWLSMLRRRSQRHRWAWSRMQ